ncbi:LacI family DNA-binding transcriptional regulator [Bifidobacterium sp. 82T10]|uniref:LacI family DNA-binding transcriptional regulator n=1 Tax=Bifidobacterium miconis TaxID=2834435 RepID=A0ABS6WFA0_9BIFI|nr:LacI family DNA-binding transcriptional regulator [Bifidobacterium miconis]MBW3092714.1 LacI family DNA-binding transcriptional regulator [Bifidobacterium miconis]
MEWERGAAQLKVADIAKLAHTSPSTVSKVINGRSGMSEATRRRVEKTLKDVGYAKKLVSTRISRSIELVVRKLSNDGAVALLQELLPQAQANGMGVGVTELGSHAEDDNLAQVIEKNPYGVVLLLSDASQTARHTLRARSIPFVIIDPVGEIPDEDLSVNIDNWTGGLAATRHLIALGHRRIAMITGPDFALSSASRAAGYEHALRESGIKLDRALIRTGNWQPEQGHDAAYSLLTMPNRPTAIFALSDLMAVGIYQAAAELGLNIPDDLSVVGFDNTFPAPYLGAGLTSVNQPFDVMAAKSIDLIRSAREGEITDRHVVLPVNLVVRDSTGEPLPAGIAS